MHGPTQGVAYDDRGLWCGPDNGTSAQVQCAAPTGARQGHTVLKLAVKELAVKELAVKELAVKELAVKELAVKECAPLCG